MSRSRMRIVFDAPQEIELDEMIELIAQAVASERESGEIEDGSGTLRWDMQTVGGGIDIDHRQRLAAAALLMGFDLPQEMMAASRSMLEAADACPGMTTADMAPMGAQGRRQALEMARRLIDDMLLEINAA